MIETDFISAIVTDSSKFIVYIKGCIPMQLTEAEYAILEDNLAITSGE